MGTNSTNDHFGNVDVHMIYRMAAAHPMNADLHSGHNRHAGHSAAMFRDKFWLSLALTLPVVYWSADVQHWFGYHAPVFSGARFIPAILGTIIFGGKVFIQGAWHELFGRQPGDCEVDRTEEAFHHNLCDMR